MTTFTPEAGTARRVGVPMLDLGYQNRQVADEIAEGFARVIEKNDFILGSDVSAFERQYADYLHVDHVVGVGNGTDALVLALRAAGIGAGDEVIVPANTFVATAEAVVLVGATVRFVDCGPDYLIDLDALRDAVSAATRAVIAVHLYGQVAPVDAIRTIVGDDVVIVEDAAQSQGARAGERWAGALGDVAATSFYPGKNLGAFGDAGAVMTRSETIANRVRAVRNHGGLRKYEHVEIGTNSRLDSLQAVVLSAKLARLDSWNDERRAIAARYTEALAAVDGVTAPLTAPGADHVFHQYVVELDDRDRVLGELNSAGIGAGIHYPVPVHLLPAFARHSPGAGAFPAAERQAGRILSLPVYPGLTETMQAEVVDQLAARL
ncbi:DegT/DnrJ/EryC1/StrS family aminotransferase [Conyzicola nivalis]|uniref:UDP-2-acetamido-2-deoxy-alpha-D-ribo-hexopyranos-3-ulose 3-aminotransferase n=1 Tax=Conyzicola nivalis TaxID=1477021 RepID=A0A916SP40_9MICO|nr:DegT/DnrJ/EryC1/StrS family aminotransferase [Conyzicola nivalis]GGB10142.1 UDP-2-acetamido-2-deoxy-alpha-D-ribo-hexopyranos-3-ulose 3-aminotransferase [Conyzicola nivalis]